MWSLDVDLEELRNAQHSFVTSLGSNGTVRDHSADQEFARLRLKGNSL